MRNFIICKHPRYHYAGQVKANEVGGACGTHGRGEEIVQGFGGKARRIETAREDGIRMVLREIGLGVWIGFYWLRIGTGCGLL
jgi:hypothetical protein